MFMMPIYVKITFEIDKEVNWLENLDAVNEFLMMKIHPTGPIIFQRGLVGINEYPDTIFIFKMKSYKVYELNA